jgi:hypothetical protein
MTTQKKKSKAVGIVKTFDHNKYLISHEPERKIVEIEATGESFEVGIKALSWSKRNQLISKNMTWDNAGNTSFSADAYVRDCLKEMIVDAPWGRTTESLLLSFDERIGAALEDLVPKAFGTDDTDENTVDAVKKEL